MNLVCLIANNLLLLLYSAQASRFSRALKQAEITQKNLLFKILNKNRDTEYGRKYGFSEIKSIDQFRKNVPLTVYEDYLPYIARIGDGERQVLTKDPVKLFEITSGSVSASKWIPYTDSLKTEFQAGIRPWIWDLYTRYPKIRNGKSYWSITPAAASNKRTKAGIPVGFDEDKEYFGRVSQVLMNLIFVSPKGVKHETDMDKFYYKTSIELLKTKDLTLISIWNPSLLLILLDYMRTHPKQLLQSLPRRRRDAVGSALKQGEYHRIWPDLCVISCWCDGAAAGYKKQLKDLFPNTVIQAKGLLATEGFMTFPWSGTEGGLLSICSHFFEFRNMRTQEFSAYSKLKRGELYEIILTTGGGLYRYCIKDTVKVTGYYSKYLLPMLRFAGKAENVSDLFGEKLNELFLGEVLAGVGDEYEMEKRFYLTAPCVNHYILYLEFLKGSADDCPNGDKLLAALIEKLLCGNFHYQYCRRLGQLNPFRVIHIYGNPRKDYLQYRTQKGQKLGDIKNTILTAEPVPPGVFEMEGDH